MPQVKETQVQVVQVRAFCNCGGELRSTGLSFPDFPVKYQHVCTVCGERYMLELVYPAAEICTKDEASGA